MPIKLKLYCTWVRLVHTAGAYPNLHNITRLGVLLLPVDGIFVHHRKPAKEVVPGLVDFAVGLHSSLYML